jgi:type IV pilus assembly protein PilX
MKCRLSNIPQYVLRRQQGVILIVSLIMLLAMTLIGVALSTGSVLQERMASNTRQSSLARQNAESGLREAEARLESLFGTVGNVGPAIAVTFNTAGDDLRVAVNTSGFDLEPLPNTFVVTDADSWTTTPAFSTAATAAAKISAAGPNQTPPRYMVEYIGLLPLNQPALNIDVSVQVSEDIPQIPHAFRITAIGYGQNEIIYSVLQSIYSTVK